MFQGGQHDEGGLNAKSQFQKETANRAKCCREVTHHEDLKMSADESTWRPFVSPQAELFEWTMGLEVRLRWFE
jgi:hypothetical protein